MGLWRVADRSLLGVLLLLRACFTRDGRWIGLLLGDPNRRGGNRLSGVPYGLVFFGHLDLQDRQRQPIEAIPISHSQIQGMRWTLETQIS